jgi:hypothetical protein
MARDIDREANAWFAQSLRFTCFTAEPVGGEAMQWWASLVGSEPEATVSRTNVSLRQQEGPFGSGRLGLILLPDRIDWHFSAANRPDLDDAEKIGGFATLGPFRDALELVRPLIFRWLEIEHAFLRVAFGAVLLQPVADRPSGYRRISKYLPAVRLDPEGSSEFSYSINRPRTTTVGGVELINRLSKWSVMASQAVQISIGLSSTHTTPNEMYHACRLELDINTPPNQTIALPGKELKAIFEKLFELGDDIAREGDQP